MIIGTTVAALVAVASMPVFGQGEVLRAAGGSSVPYHIPTTDPQSGIVIDLLNAIGADAGFTVEYLPPRPFAELIPAVAAGEIDLIANNVGITAARLELVDFSIPYHNGADGLVVAATNNTAYTSLQDLAGQVVGTLRGSLYDAGLNAMTGLFREVRLYATIAETIQAVANGEITAAVLSSVPVEYGIAEAQFTGVKVVPTYTPQFPTPLGLVLAKNRPELLARINASLGRLIADGTVSRIFSDYGIAWLAP
jgi:polar amino acid transport system substrate-binding protein